MVVLIKSFYLLGAERKAGLGGRETPCSRKRGDGVCSPCGHPALGWAVNLPKPRSNPWAGWKKSTQCCEQAKVTLASRLRLSLQGRVQQDWAEWQNLRHCIFLWVSPAPSEPGKAQHIPKELGFTYKGTKQIPIVPAGKRHLFLEAPRFHADINYELICSGDQYSKQLFPASCTPTISQCLPLLSVP